MNTLVLFFALFISGSCFLFAQEIDQEILGIVIPQERVRLHERLQLSISQQNYPISPGDVYQLNYRSASGEVSREITVESDYTLNLNLFGKINTSTMSYSELKLKIEEIVSNAFPGSFPYLKIISVGMFQVLLKGEIEKTQFVTAWGLSRLSDIIKDHMGLYSSVREIGIISAEGNLRKYDIFKALHQGVIEENPFVKPGDTVLIYRRGREVVITGEIYKPGRYQLLEEEGLQELIADYANR